MAGGRGARIAPLYPDTPKPLINIAGKPILEWEIEALRDQGFKQIILTVSHLRDQIIRYFGDGSDLGVNIEYFEEDKPLGNAGALLYLQKQLDQDFILINGDLVFDVDLHRMIAFHRSKSALVTIFTHPNSHPYDSALLEADSNGAVLRWIEKDKKRDFFYKNRVNAGIHIISPKVLEQTCESLFNTKTLGPDLSIKVDLDRHVLKPLAGTGKMFCYDSPEYVRDVGTPDRFRLVEKDLLSGNVKKNLQYKQKAIFLDRDGTINKYVGFLRKPDQLELLPGVAEAIRIINTAGYLCVVVTNQPVLARGEVTVSELNDIHNKMETLLGLEGAYVDAIYYCPHHPDRGYPQEVKELKIECECRKPKPGLLLQAAKRFHIDLENSWMVGDSKDDILAGKNAGCKTCLLGHEQYGQNCSAESLNSFVKKVILT